MSEHWFWALLTTAVVIWYSTVTIYVAIRGMTDIRSMLHEIATRNAKPPEKPPA